MVFFLGWCFEDWMAIDCFCNCLEHLIVAPVITTLGQGCGAVAEEMLEGPSFSTQRAGRRLSLAPGVKVGWTR